jgi:hypothetical protein
MSKPTLKVNTVTIHKVDYSDLDDFFRLVYNNKRIECVPAEEWSNDEAHEFTIDTKPLDKYDAGQVEKVKEGKFVHGSTGSLLQDCCVNGLIAPGRYLIEVCW